MVAAPGAPAFFARSSAASASLAAFSAVALASRRRLDACPSSKSAASSLSSAASLDEGSLIAGVFTLLGIVGDAGGGDEADAAGAPPLPAPAPPLEALVMAALLPVGQAWDEGALPAAPAGAATARGLVSPSLSREACTAGGASTDMEWKVLPLVVGEGGAVPSASHHFHWPILLITHRMGTLCVDDTEMSSEPNGARPS